MLKYLNLTSPAVTLHLASQRHLAGPSVVTHAHGGVKLHGQHSSIHVQVDTCTVGG